MQKYECIRVLNTTRIVVHISVAQIVAIIEAIPVRVPYLHVNVISMSETHCYLCLTLGESTFSI